MIKQPFPIFNISDITALSACDIALSIKNGYFSAREAVEAHIQRIETVNPILNAVIAYRFEQALIEADEADSARAKGEPIGPLHGVPITIKDQFMVKGLPTTWGLPSRATNVAAEEGPLVTRLRRAGAIILGKTNVPELLSSHESDNLLYGRTNNPWNLKRTPGGSSGGEASIIAACGSPLGLGADIGGSIRIPCHFCGLQGLKPTSGRLTNLDAPNDLFPLGQETILVQPGPLARSVADLALAMSILAAPGQEQLDPSVAPIPWHEPFDISLESLRVAIYTDDGFFSTAPALRRAVYEAADALCTLGAIVEEWKPPEIPLAMHLFAGTLSADGGAYIKRLVGKDLYRSHLRGFLLALALPNIVRPALSALTSRAKQRLFAYILRSVRSYSTDGYMQLIMERALYRARFVKALEAKSFDIILCPPDAVPAFPHGESRFLNIAGSYSMLYNLLGMPAGVVAATRVRPDEEKDNILTCDIIERDARGTESGSTGLPVGVQVVGRHWREDIVLSVMKVLEEHFSTKKDYPLRPVL